MPAPHNLTEAQRDAMARHTLGPWEWFGNARNNEVYLATAHSGRRYVMGFQRWGMRGAQPTFQPAERGLVPASKLFTFEVGDRSVRGVEQARADDSVYRLDISGIDCADGYLIAASPELYEALNATFFALIGLHIATGKQSEAAEQAITRAGAALRKARGEQA